MQVKTLSTSRYNTTNATSSMYVDYLVVAAGGGGGARHAGGGGARQSVSAGGGEVSFLRWPLGLDFGT